MSLEIRNMESIDEYFVGTCTHIGESDEIDACAQRRLTWLRGMYQRGLRVKVAILNGNQVGFLYVMPIEISPWGPIGKDILVVPCLVVSNEARHKKIGRALIETAEREAEHQGRKGVITMGYYHDFWFMPAPFFERCGSSAAKHKDKAAILWKVFDASTEIPRFLKRNYKFRPVSGKVVVDLFWNTFCQTSDIEANRVQEVVAEFGDSVVLNEYCSDD